jgi:transglutaminase-like putative cysteine protease
MLFSVVHRTTYRYASAVSLSHHTAHLRPLDLPYQTCRSHQLVISPLPTSIEEDRDYFGNGVTAFNITQPHQELMVEATSEVEIVARERPDHLSDRRWEDVATEAAGGRTPGALYATEFLFPSPSIDITDSVVAFAQDSFITGRSILDAVLDLNRRIFEEFTFDPQATTVTTAPAEVLMMRRGVCQDFAHLAIACCRAVGVPARYISGYLETQPPRGQPRLIGADASHAWLSVFCGNGDWIDIDPTNDLLAGTGHIAIATGRDYRDVSPLRGIIIGGGEHSIDVGVDVERLLI